MGALNDNQKRGREAHGGARGALAGDGDGAMIAAFCLYISSFSLFANSTRLGGRADAHAGLRDEVVVGKYAKCVLCADYNLVAEAGVCVAQTK